MAEKSLSLHQLIALSHVVEQGSITRAAEQLDISQPSVSQQIKELAEACGMPLIVQRGRGVAPTALGETLAAIGRRLRIEAERASKAVADHRSGTGGRLLVGASLTTGAFLAPLALLRLRDTRPQLAVELRIANTAEVIEFTADELVDIGVVEGSVQRTELLVAPFHRDLLQCMSAANHPLANRRVEARALLGETLILRERGSGTREAVVSALHDAGLAFARTLEIGSAEAIRVAVAAGLGISWISPLTSEQSPSLCEIDVSDLRIERTMSVIRRRDLAPTPAVEAFVAALHGVALEIDGAR
ncbi:MAG: LysR family transcriptional regulator [bacterium]|nr:LysR family transcriptional regulator [bacterium]